jgi:DNA-binding NarL/FixJ family response regulator
MANLNAAERDDLQHYIVGIALPEIEQIAEDEWQHFMLKLALESVSQRFRPNVMQAFQLISEGKSGIEVAEQMGIPQNTVHVYKNRVQRALVKEIVALEYELG